MANNPEQIDAFEDQIEQSLDYSIEELSRLDEEKAEALKALKSSILDKIKLDRDEYGEFRYSEDLQITDEELKSIYKELQEANPQIFEENEIREYDDFKEFLGMRREKDEKISFTPSMSEMTLFGEAIELLIPVGASEQTIENYKKILKKIEERPDLEEFISPDTKILARGNNRLEFSIEREGKIVKYSASPEGVLRVDKEPSSEIIKEWTRVTLEIKKLERALKQTLDQDEMLPDYQKEIIRDKVLNGVENETSLLIIPQYLEIINEIGVLKKRNLELEGECSTRVLFDEETGEDIREVSDPRYNNGFSYYYAADRIPQKTITYNSRAKESFTEYTSIGITKRTIGYFANGNEKHVQENDEYGVYLSSREYREDGTLIKIQTEKKCDMYSKDGTMVLYKTEGRNVLMVGSDGKSFGSFKEARAKAPHLTEFQYMEYIKKEIKTAEQYHIFEENLIVDSGLSKDSMSKIYLIGKEVLGIAEKERLFESKYGIEVETEDWNKSGIDCKKFSVSGIDGMLNLLFIETERYPRILIQKSGLKKIYIFSSFEENLFGGEQIRAGGYAFHGSEDIAISTTRGVFDHELFHRIDMHYGGIDDDNDKWGKRAHGDDYKSLYGRHGREAIISGKGGGPRPIGHPSAYGKYGGINEDQADMAKALMQNQEEVLKHIGSEPALAEKAKMIKELYFKISEGRMDKKYWDDLRSGEKIDDAYWARREAAQDFVGVL
ncbi:hypothetical protein HOE67_03965 [Candidatus Peregrinibacteria bacterium]|mgnify:CR=1 FL=1|nr:hypothetical protein [Candidatus Peregrinibacteria bacterium]MBT4056241.1 hypothetical protein [Candidatus Peregrinibacteria bacterium]